MGGISSLLGTEVWPWVRDTVSIGVVAGLANAGARAVVAKWQQRPLIDYKLETSRNNEGIYSGRLGVMIYNRAPAPLDFNGVEVISPDVVLVRENQRNREFAKSAFILAPLPPSLPSATQFSKASVWFDLSWPDEGCAASIQVMMRSRYQWVIRPLSRISIKLPKKRATAEPTTKPAKSSSAVKA
jgi:hypothetical protein